MDLNTFFARYRPYLAILAAVAALVAFLPGDDDGTVAATNAPVAAAPVASAPTGGGLAPGTGGTGGGTGADIRSGVEGPTAASPGVTSSGATGTGAAGTATPGTSGGSATDTTVASASSPASSNPLDNPECDPATGRIRIPTNFAPPCVPVFSGDNGGVTNQGVTEDTITVAWYRGESDPAVSAALTAAGANNDPEDVEATMLGYVEIFNEHFETYGRTVDIKIFNGTGDTADEAVGRADALAIATEIKPFAVFGSPNNAFVDELAARKILCICTASQPQEFYERHAPYVGYTTLMASTQGYIHRAEYVGKRLAGRNAVHAGTSDGLPMNIEERKFGLLYYDTEDGAYKAGVDFFVKHLRETYGVEMTEVVAYPSDLAEAQERARPIIQRFKSSGVTTLLFSGDFINPATYTREATNQAYFPEWIVTGSVLTDTTIFARTYDPNQWQRAFGVSFLVVRSPDEFNSAYRLWDWHFGDAPPPADNQFKVIYPTPFTFFLGVHLAGPNLTVESWQQGLFSYPVTGQGMVTSPSFSFGNHGVWPFTDYLAYDDIVEIWWDPTATGEDEVGNEGVGMYRYVDFGRRYLPGQQPTVDPVVFTSPETAPAFLDEPPANETPPDYAHEDHG